MKKPLWIFCISSCFACRTNICFTLAVYRHQCECKPGYFGTGETGDCTDTCEGRCQNEVSLFVSLCLVVCCVWFYVCPHVGKGVSVAGRRWCWAALLLLTNYLKSKVECSHVLNFLPRTERPGRISIKNIMNPLRCSNLSCDWLSSWYLQITLVIYNEGRGGLGSMTSPYSAILF